MSKAMALAVGLVFGITGTGAAQIKTLTGKAQMPSSLEGQIEQLRKEVMALREAIVELKQARRGQMPTGPGTMGGGMGPMMQPMMQMMRACGQMMGMMGQMGGMSGMMSEQQPEPEEQAEPTEHGTKQAGGLEVTLLTAPPLSASKMQELMPGMGGMGGMQATRGIQGMMGGMGETQPTHWIGVIVRDAKADRVVPDLPVTLTAQKAGVVRTVKLMPMAGSYGANISLLEKGRYNVTVAIARPDQPVALAFELGYR